MLVKGGFTCKNHTYDNQLFQIDGNTYEMDFTKNFIINFYINFFHFGSFFCNYRYYNM